MPKEFKSDSGMRIVYSDTASNSIWIVDQLEYQISIQLEDIDWLISSLNKLKNQLSNDSE